MDPTEDAEKESSALVLETFEVRFEGEEGEKIWAGDPPSGRDDEMLPKVGLIAINSSSFWLFSEESGEISVSVYEIRRFKEFEFIRALTVKSDVLKNFCHNFKMKTDMI